MVRLLKHFPARFSLPSRRNGRLSHRREPALALPFCSPMSPAREKVSAYARHYPPFLGFASRIDGHLEHAVAECCARGPTGHRRRCARRFMFDEVLRERLPSYRPRCLSRSAERSEKSLLPDGLPPKAAESHRTTLAFKDHCSQPLQHLCAAACGKLKNTVRRTVFFSERPLDELLSGRLCHTMDSAKSKRLRSAFSTHLPRTVS